MTRLAILSPNKEKYTETFIHAHKALPFEKYFYSDGHVPEYLEGHGPLPAAASTLPELNAEENNFRASLQQNKINIVLATYGLTAAECLRAIRSLHLPLLVHFQEVVSTHESAYRHTFAYASTVFVISEEMKKEVMRLGCPEEKIILTYQMQTTDQYLADMITAITKTISQHTIPTAIPSYVKPVNNFISHHLITQYTWPDISFSDIIFFQVIIQAILNIKVTTALQLDSTAMQNRYLSGIKEPEDTPVLSENAALIDTLLAACQPAIMQLHETPAYFYRIFPWLLPWENICQSIVDTPGFGWHIFEDILKLTYTNLYFRQEQPVIVNHVMSQCLISLSDITCSMK